jgi:uncharacterized repeat protein (TIGR01451 family)
MNRLIMFVLLVWVALAGVLKADTQPVTTLYSFFQGPANPRAGLTLGKDGNFYGTTQSGGSGQGTVFKLTTNGITTTLVNFNYSNGSDPVANLLLGPDGNFYGTTSGGGTTLSGTNVTGTVFRMTTNGTLTTLVNFNGVNGGIPLAGLALGPDGNFYGTTEFGGTNGDGTVFKMTTNGTLTTLVNFNGTNGANPLASLTAGPGGNLYGTTEYGGTEYGGTNGSWGTVFQVTTNGTFTTLLQFGITNGALPYGGVTVGPDGNLYGTTAFGGNPNGDFSGGSIFELTTNGVVTTLVRLADLGGTNGLNPYAGLTLGPDGNFYGTTYAGGANGNGTVFQVTTNGTLTTLYSFSVLTNGINPDGAQPQASLTLGPDGNFYGTAYGGGTTGFGTVFKVSTNGTFSTVASFIGDTGVNPESTLTPGPDGSLYGTAKFGGIGGRGTLFKLTTSGALTMLVNFDSANDGANPQAGLIVGPGGNFYGTAVGGGTNRLDLGGNNFDVLSDGTVFELTTNGILTALTDFNGTNGANPYGGLAVGTDDNLYGTTAYGGISNDGTIFQIMTNGTLTTLTNFNGLNGANPGASMTLGPDGNFYGTCEAGGTNGNGTVFQVTTNGALTTLVYFNGTNGANPNAGLTLGPDGSFYGTAYGGNFGHRGTVFKLTTSGTLTTLVNFAQTNGSGPLGGLALGPDGNFYGTTSQGGVGGAGTVFKMAANGTLTTLANFNFNDANGDAPFAALTLQTNGNFIHFYGTTYNGGGGGGTVFQLNLTTAYAMAENSTNTFFPLTNEVAWTTGGTLSLVNAAATNGTGQITGSGIVFKPTANFIGTATINYAVTNNAGGTNVSLITVLVTNVPPVANPDVYTVAENSSANVLSPLTNDVTETSGGVLSLVSVSPTNGTAVISGTNVLFTPQANFTGTATIGYTITDNVGGTNSSLITVTVTVANSISVVTITAPTSGQVVSNAAFTVTGTAAISGNPLATLTNVYVQLNSGGWTGATSANGWTNWTANVTLTAGSNTVSAYAVDTYGNVSTTNSVTFDYVVTAGGLFAGPPGTPVSGFNNRGGESIIVEIGGGIGVQSITNAILFSANATAFAGDVVFLRNPNGGTNPTNWAAVLRFVNPGDPTGTNGLAATEYETYFQTNAGPNYFAGFSLLPNVDYLPIASTNANGSIEASTDVFGPVGAILAGQEAIIAYTASIQPSPFAGPPGTPASGFNNPGTPTVVIGIGGGIGVQPITNNTIGFFSANATALAGDVVFLINTNNGTSPTNWAAVLRFVNPADPTGTNGLAATEYETYFPTNAGSNTFAGFSLLPNVDYLPIASTNADGSITADAVVFGTVGGIESGQEAIMVYTASIQPSPFAVTITSPTAGQVETNQVISVFGTAPLSNGAAAVAKVWIQFNNGGWFYPQSQSPNNWTNWESLLVPLTPGSNTVQAYAVDTNGVVSATNSVTFDYVVTAGAQFAGPPGTPVSGWKNPGGHQVIVSVGGGIGVQSITNAILFSANATVLAGDVVFLRNPINGNNPTNWAAVLRFFNPGDPTGTNGLAATEYETYFQTNPGPNTFAGFSLLPNVDYLPIASTNADGSISADAVVNGPVGAILLGQQAIMDYTASIQPSAGAQFAGIPGTPTASWNNPGGSQVVIGEGGGIGVQTIMQTLAIPSFSFTATPGNVVMLINPNGGTNMSNWKAVVKFFNPSDPTGTNGLVATDYQTFFPTNAGPNAFANVPLFTNVDYVPITATNADGSITAGIVENGPAGGILAGQQAIIVLTASVQPSAGADLSLSASAAPEPVGVGSNLVYSLTVSNAGPATAAGVVVSNQLPAGVSFVSATGGATPSSGILLVNLGSLATGAVTNAQVIVQPTAAGNLTNTFQVFANEVDPNVTNNSASVVSTVTNAPVINQGIPGTPVSTNWNPGGATVLLSEGGGIGVQPILYFSVPFTATPGDVVMLIDPNGGTNTSNWKAVVNFFNPSDPTGTNGLVATEYQTFFPTNAGPNYFANFPLFTSVAYVPIASTNADGSITAFYEEYGPSAGGFYVGQEGIIIYTAAIQPSTGADLSLSASAAPEPVGVGSNLVYSLTVSNAGSATATGVIISNQLPAGVTFVSVTGGATPANGVLLVNLGSLAVGATNSVQIVMQPTAAGKLTNLFQVFANQTDPVLANNSATVVSTVTNPPPMQADLSLGGTNSAVATFTDNLVYYLSITNHGPSAATGVVVSNQIPAGIMFVSATDGATPTNDILLLNLGTLALGAVTNVTITMTPTNYVPGFLTNVFQVSANESDPVPANNSAAFITQLELPTTDFTTSSAEYDTNQTTTVSQQVTNYSTELIAKLPDGTVVYDQTFTTTYSDPAVQSAITTAAGDLTTAGAASYSGPAQTGFSQTTNHSSVTVPISTNLTVVSGTKAWVGPVTIPVGNFGVVTGYTFDPVVTNYAIPTGGNPQSLTLTAGQTDYDTMVLSIFDILLTTTNTINYTNSAVYTMTGIVAQADLKLSASTAPEPVGVGSNLVYTISITNLGPNAASGVTVSNRISAGVTFVSATGGATPFSGVLLVNLGSLANGAVTNAQVIVQPTAAGKLTNLFQVFASTADPVLTNNSAAVVSTITNAPPPPVDVALNLTAAPNPVGVGAPLTYSLTLTNNSSTTATSVVVSNTLPPNVTLFSLLPSQGAATNQGNVVTYSVGSLPNGNAATLAIVVLPNAAGLLTNTASVSSLQTDSQPANNYATNVTTAVNVPITNLVLTVLSAVTLNPQTGLFEQRIEVSNGGPTTPSSVLVLISGLPANATLYDATGTTNGIPYVQSSSPLGIGSNVVFLLEYYVPTRVAPTNLTLTVQAGPVVIPPVVSGTILSISRMIKLDNGSVLVEFSAVPGQVYAIQYSSDMVMWLTAIPAITAPANRVQWIDSGPPQTVSSPAQQGARYYRVVLLTAH